MDDLQDDVLTALDRADAAGEHDLLVRLAAAARALFPSRGLLGPGRTWLDRALELASEERRGAVLVGLAGLEMIRSRFGAMARYARDARPLVAGDPPLEAEALFYELLFTTYADPAGAARHVARARELLDGGLPRDHAALLLVAVGAHHLWLEADDQAITAFAEARGFARGQGTAGSIAEAGFLLGLVLANRPDEIDGFLRTNEGAPHRREWREHARRGQQWNIAAELAVATAMSTRGDHAGARRLVADLHLLVGRDRVSGIDADLLVTLAAIRLAEGDQARACVLLTDTVWTGRTPPTTSNAYRTLAAATGAGTRDTVAWRSTELMRRFAMDHAALDENTRRMLDDELAALGLVTAGVAPARKDRERLDAVE